MPAERARTSTWLDQSLLVGERVHVADIDTDALDLREPSIQRIANGCRQRLFQRIRTPGQQLDRDVQKRGPSIAKKRVCVGDNTYFTIFKPDETTVGSAVENDLHGVVDVNVRRERIPVFEDEMWHDQLGRLNVRRSPVSSMGFAVEGAAGLYLPGSWENRTTPRTFQVLISNIINADPLPSAIVRNTRSPSTVVPVIRAPFGIWALANFVVPPAP